MDALGPGKNEGIQSEELQSADGLSEITENERIAVAVEKLRSAITLLIQIASTPLSDLEEIDIHEMISGLNKIVVEISMHLKNGAGLFTDEELRMSEYLVNAEIHEFSDPLKKLQFLYLSIRSRFSEYVEYFNQPLSQEQIEKTFLKFFNIKLKECIADPSWENLLDLRTLCWVFQEVVLALDSRNETLVDITAVLYVLEGFLRDSGADIPPEEIIKELEDVQDKIKIFNQSKPSNQAS